VSRRWELERTRDLEQQRLSLQDVVRIQQEALDEKDRLLAAEHAAVLEQQEAPRRPL
jgi:hypothetical protein